MRCTCGYTRFAEKRISTRTEVQRWCSLYPNVGPGSGHGLTFGYDYASIDTTPPITAGFGTYFAAWLGGDPDGYDYGDGIGTWGRYTRTLAQASLSTYCEACKRERRRDVLGGVAVIEGFPGVATYQVLVSDLQAPYAGMVLKLWKEGLSYEVDLSIQSGALAPVPSSPELRHNGLPAGAVAATTVLVATYPDVAEGGEYRVDFLDRRTDFLFPLGTVTLESSVQLLLPKHADLGGAPSLWLKGPGLLPAVQPQSSSVETVPFDYCDAVLEYDASLGTSPEDQGWVYTGDGTAADYSNQGTGSLQAQTTQVSYWETAVTLGDNPGSVHAYMKYMTADVGSGAGLELQALRATALAAYNGIRVSDASDGLRATQLDDLAHTTMVLPRRPNGTGWESLGGSEAAGAATIWRDGEAETASYGTAGVAGGTELVARFGDTDASGLWAWVRNVVCSAPGRFIRARWTAFTPVAAPVLRFAMSRPAVATTGNSARFILRYGQGSDPYGRPATTKSFAVPVTVTQNQSFEVPVSLTGLVANTTFWLSLERDWDNAGDTFVGTVHLHHITVRAT